MNPDTACKPVFAHSQRISILPCAGLFAGQREHERRRHERWRHGAIFFEQIASRLADAHPVAAKRSRVADVF
jgi:hypothetical protein